LLSWLYKPFSQVALPLSQVGKNRIHIEVELRRQLFACAPDFLNDLIFSCGKRGQALTLDIGM
jgi:hypothetical protein